MGCLSLKRAVVGIMTPDYEGNDGELVAVFDGNDEGRPQLPIKLQPVATGLIQPTDVQFVPGSSTVFVGLEKTGKAKWFDIEAKRHDVWFDLAVLDRSEQGLLGLAFHPQFTDNGRFFINAVVERDGDPVTQVSEWQIEGGTAVPGSKPKKAKVILEVEQPYPNHNAGQLAFGPKGMLFVGFGDGGWKDDPLGAGQDPKRMLGKMLRIDVDRPDPDGSRAYSIPSDNPFVTGSPHRPETFAFGLRNPWRYSFDPKGRLVIGDVGQNAFEEITILAAGENGGWKVREARHCFEPAEDCPTEGLVDPVFEYGRNDGGSVTGGYVVTDGSFASLSGKYVFGDFLSGRLWAIDLPENTAGPLAKASTLGRWPILPSTFGRDAQGRVYVASYRSGTVFRVEQP